MYELSFYRNNTKVFDHQLDVWDVRIGAEESDDIRLLDGLAGTRARLSRVGHGWQLTYQDRTIREHRSLTPGDSFPIDPYSVLLRQHPVAPERPAVPERFHEALSSAPGRSRTTVATLTVLNGPDAGTVWPLKTHQLSIGGPGSTITLQDPLLQPAHCLVQVTAGCITVAEGAGPVYVNNRKIGLVQPVCLKDQIRIGRTRLQYDVQHSDTPPAPRFGPMRGHSRHLKKLFGHLSQLATHDLRVQLIGESGTGKTLAAQTMHAHSNRQDGPLVLFRCDEHSEAESLRALFGEAHSDGLLHQADDGTLVLQEVGRLSLEVQSRLAEALASGRVRRPGSHTGPHSDFRLITTSSQDLKALVKQDAFRVDLLENLGNSTVRFPPLRTSWADIDGLVRHFLSAHPGALPLAQEERDLLMQHPWPGNVRELKSLLRELVTHDRSCLLRLVGGADVLRSDIRARLDRHGGKVRPAALELGLTDNGLRNRMEKLGMR